MREAQPEPIHENNLDVTNVTAENEEVEDEINKDLNETMESDELDSDLDSDESMTDSEEPTPRSETGEIHDEKPLVRDYSTLDTLPKVRKIDSVPSSKHTTPRSRSGATSSAASVASSTSTLKCI